MCRIWKQEEWIMAELNIAIAEDNTLMLELLGNKMDSMWLEKQTMEKTPIR